MSSAKKARELNRAKTEHDTTKLSAQFAASNHTMLNIAESVLAKEIESLKQQLAECQATNGVLREAFASLPREITSELEGLANEQAMLTVYRVVEREALNIPDDDATALNELIAERTASLTAELAIARKFADSEDEQMRRQITELTAEVERLKLLEDSALKVCSQLDEIVLAMPYDYLDPPDGGNVSLSEQVSRMYAEVKQLRANVECVQELTAQRDAAMKDAERYRWLRSEHAINDPMASVVWKRNYDRKESEWVNTSDVHSLDHAIDAAIANCGETFDKLTDAMTQNNTKTGHSDE